MATLPTSVPARPPAARDALLIAAACGLAAALVVLWLVGSAVVAAAFLGTALVLTGALVAWRRLYPGESATVTEPDWTVARAIAAGSPDAIAVTDRAGRLVCATDRYEAVFGGFPTPPGLPVDAAGVERLGAAGRAAWRDGSARVDRLVASGGTLAAEVTRAGAEGDLLVWRFVGAEGIDLARTMEQLIAGPTGDRLGSAGIMAALVNPDGRIRVANRVLRARAMGHEDGAIVGRDFARFLITDAHGMARFEREGLMRNPLRVLQIPFLDGEDAPMLVALIDEEDGAGPAIGADAGAHIQSLVALMPFGVALIGADGRFLQMNDAFARAAAVDPASPPIYPGDLVVREDKGVVADAIRRFAGGATHSTDLAVRLKDYPDEPVALSIAGARGLGDSAVLLSLKDNSEETRLKREVAQAIKMQAVGQLAGGVAHDFNNILTAIIGYCDLMLMRHAPGDSDYDDIQQIRANSNRAAALTRQLLAFSRQQTLRPQILQLPDVISEVTNLLKRVIGETVTLTVKHGRALSPVRADPGQLEQVVVNLAVNARDAMMGQGARGGGTLAIQTYAVTAADVRRLGSDILPPADYTVLEMSDTGSGIPVEILPKIFEPFFTTKEVGKGTGLGLSTVYGIVKQSGGWIFADNRRTGAPEGRRGGEQGAVFTIYLPIHSAGALPDATPVAVRTPPREKPGELWGTGTILLVEDEDMVRVVAERALTRQGYTVLSAEHGEAALELLASNPRPDLLISDVMMPLMDGPTMVRHARARYPDLPILFMSGYAEETIRKTIDLDDVAFLAKPFTVQQLAEATRDVLSTK